MLLVPFANESGTIFELDIEVLLLVDAESGGKPKRNLKNGERLEFMFIFSTPVSVEQHEQ